jgi:uncharacterized membrane protein (UPF0127 family)
MRRVTVWNETNQTALAERAEVADRFFPRLRGLLGRQRLLSGEGLILLPCKSVHTLGMKFPIDVLFVDGNGRILKIIAEMAPGRVSPVVKGAKCVVELPARQSAETATLEGDRIVFLDALR